MDWNAIVAIGTLATAIFTWVLSRFADRQTRIAQKQTEISKTLARLQEEMAKAERMGLIHLEARGKLDSTVKEDSPNPVNFFFFNHNFSLTNLGRYGCLVYKVGIAASENADGKEGYQITTPLLSEEVGLAPGGTYSWQTKWQLRSSRENPSGISLVILVEARYGGNPQAIERHFFKMELDEKGSPKTSSLGYLS
ncbi:hypothetical protein KQ693_12810 (plasmid) [Thermus sp. PS18]|uniref:hypothetical protein n=1 Tax=Thermus sp. PS18 TaxID=2849039 RepID=UPI002264DE02|nr:hypothetical protein [Thermus sp. PS18]UZX16822.1 hypothetical protein KQ693_12810 [Thermus sp. PS18]